MSENQADMLFKRVIGKVDKKWFVTTCKHDSYVRVGNGMKALDTIWLSDPVTAERCHMYLSRKLRAHFNNT